MTTDGARAPLVCFDAVGKRFGGMPAVEQLSLDIAHNEFFALLGPSGCGKTTLLRMLAGFETPDEGRILLDGQDIVAVPPHRRPVNMMFQSYALFPHLSVERNIAFGLKQDGVGAADIAVRVEEMLTLVRLTGLGKRRPDQLSGGQRQRVALARALVKRPRVLLLDEPMAALDKKLRAETQFELAELRRKLGTTFVIVTHDQDEAMIVADRIGVMNRGALIQVAPPAEIYERPNSRWVAEFIGDVNLIEGVLSGDGRALDTVYGRLPAGEPAGASAGERVWLALRPEKLVVRADGAAAPSAGSPGIAGTVTEIGYLGDLSRLVVRTGDGRSMKVTVANDGSDRRRFGVGEAVQLSWPVSAGVLVRR